MPDPAFAELVAKARLSELVAEYANLIDWLDWDRLGGVFWPDATFDFGMFKGDFPQYREFVAGLEEGYARRLHMFGIPTVTLSGTEPGSTPALSSCAAPTNPRQASMMSSGAATSSLLRAAEPNGGFPGLRMCSTCSTAPTASWTIAAGR